MRIFMIILMIMNILIIISIVVIYNINSLFINKYTCFARDK
nr:MAG TPA: hypothetical protein [Crassvirales sp.]